MSRRPHERERPDLRLVPGAVAAWAAALGAGPLSEWSPPTAITASVVSIAAAVWLVRGGSRSLAVAAVLACAGAVMAGGVLRFMATGGSVLADLAEQRAVAQVSVVITGDPRPITPGRAASGDPVQQVLVPARVEHIQARGGAGEPACLRR